MSFEKTNLHFPSYKTESQQDNNNNSLRLNEIKEKDYTDFRQLMDIALKNFPLKEKQKYMDSVLEDYKNTLSINYSSSYFYGDHSSSTSSIESSGQLPYEIKFDGDDDFEQVLPLKIVSWDISTEESECCSLYLKASSQNHSDIEYIDSLSSHTKPAKCTLSFKKKIKKEGLWAKVKKVFARLMCCTKQQTESKTSQKTAEEVSDNLVEENHWHESVAEESNSMLQTKGRLGANYITFLFILQL